VRWIDTIASLNNFVAKLNAALESPEK